MNPQQKLLSKHDSKKTAEKMPLGVFSAVFYQYSSFFMKRQSHRKGRTNFRETVHLDAAA